MQLDEKEVTNYNHGNGLNLRPLLKEFSGSIIKQGVIAREIIAFEIEIRMRFKLQVHCTANQNKVFERNTLQIKPEDQGGIRIKTILKQLLR